MVRAASGAQCSPVRQAMSAEIAIVDRRSPLEEAVRRMQEKSLPALAVVEPDGRLVGLISTETIGELMLVSQAMPEGLRVGPWSRPAGA